MSDLPKASELRPGQMIAVEALDELLVVANIDGAYYAFSDICTHHGCSLSDGTLAGTTVICPCHGGTFEVATGKVVGGPPQRDIAAYRVTVDGDNLTIEAMEPASGERQAPAAVASAPPPPAATPPSSQALSSIELPKASEVRSGQMVAVQALDELLVVANIDGAYYAFSNTCTHRGCSLSEGMLAGATVICPCHGGTYEVATGKVVGGPPQRDIAAYRVTVDGDNLTIEASAPATADLQATPAVAAAPPPPPPPPPPARAASPPVEVPPIDAASAVDVLRVVPLFSGISEEALQALASFAFRRSFAPGELIVEEGRTGNGLYVVASGNVEVVKSLGSEREQVLAVLGAGEPFGEMALLGEWPRTASVRALEPTECLGMDRWVFLAHLNREPRLAVRMLQTLALRLAESSRRLAE